MIYNVLGQTGIRVSKIAFGSLTMGPLQRNLSEEEGASLIEYAYLKGINFIDTAELYETYGHIREALKKVPRRDYVIATKSYAYSRETARDSIEKALLEMGTTYIDLFMLHEQSSIHSLRGHYEAVETLLRYKEQGIVKAIGLSTHYIEGVKAAFKYPEIEFVHPIVNIKGVGIQDGSMDEMAATLSAFHANGGGVFGMKPLGGGNLLHSIDKCFDFVFSRDYVDAIAFGMQSEKEIDYNVARLLGQTQALVPVPIQEKKLHIADWCTKCGACVNRCDHKALSMGPEGVIIDRERCVLCGYCAPVCPEFCIKVF